MTLSNIVRVWNVVHFLNAAYQLYPIRARNRRDTGLAHRTINGFGHYKPSCPLRMSVLV